MNGNSINRVELQGRVGTVRIQSAGGRITNSMYAASDGIGQIHLEESGLALIPGTDEYEVL